MKSHKQKSRNFLIFRTPNLFLQVARDGTQNKAAVVFHELFTIDKRKEWSRKGRCCYHVVVSWCLWRWSVPTVEISSCVLMVGRWRRDWRQGLTQPCSVSLSLSGTLAHCPGPTPGTGLFSLVSPLVSLDPAAETNKWNLNIGDIIESLVQSIAIKSPDLYVFYPSNLDIRLAILPLDLGEEDKDPTCQTVTHCIKEWRRVGLFKTGKMCFVYQYHTT